MNERTQPTARLEIAVVGELVRLSRDGHELELKLGEPKSVERDGQSATVTAEENDGQLVVRTEGKKGRRTTTYRRTDDGHLLLAVRMEGGRLKSPLAFERTYDPAKSRGDDGDL